LSRLLLRLGAAGSQEDERYEYHECNDLRFKFHSNTLSSCIRKLFKENLETSIIRQLGGMPVKQIYSAKSDLQDVAH
jgi:hypothetical protein